MSTATKVDRDLARALADCALENRSGIVTAVRGKLKRLFCLDEGFLVFAASNVIEEQFSEFLVREQLVSVGELAEVQHSGGAQGASPARLLVEQEIVEQRTIEQALERHFRELLFSTLDWCDGESTLAHGRPDLTGEFTTRMPCVPLLLEFAQEHPASIEDLRAKIGSTTARPAVREERSGLLNGIEIAPAARHLLAGCDGETPIDEIVSSAPAEAEAVWRSLYAMVLIGIVEPSAGEAAADEAALNRAEILAQLERVQNADHYGVLGLPSTASSDRIRDAYYTLARQYHPDRFRTGPLGDLREQIEGFFASVTEAYNTLYDPRRRAAYDRQQASTQEERREPDTASLARENYRRGKALVARGRFTDALTSLENAVRLDGRKAAYRVELGKLMARNPRLRQQAEQHLIEANRLDPSLVDGYLALGDLYLKTRRRDDAVRLFREVLRWEPGHLEATERLRTLRVR